MNIIIDKNLTLTTYSKDCIAIKKGNETICSSKDIIHPMNWLYKNAYKELKNHVFPILNVFRDKDIEEYQNSFNTQNYSVEFDDKREYIIKDKSNPNNTRWLYHKRKMVETIYLLEVSRLDSKSIDELVADIKELNICFNRLKDS